MSFLCALYMQVHFDICDATLVEFPENYFDVVYSRDTILHIQDKLTLFQKYVCIHLCMYCICE